MAAPYESGTWLESLRWLGAPMAGRKRKTAGDFPLHQRRGPPWL